MIKTDRSYGLEYPARRDRTKQRARPQTGVEGDKRARQSMMRRVRKGDIRYARRLTHSRTAIVLEYEGRELAFVYSNASQEILCFLAPGAPEISDWAERQTEPATAARRPCFRGEGTER